MGVRRVRRMPWVPHRSIAPRLLPEPPRLRGTGTGTGTGTDRDGDRDGDSVTASRVRAGRGGAALSTDVPVSGRVGEMVLDVRRANGCRRSRFGTWFLGLWASSRADTCF